ncbi:MAG: hypothetical protein SV775_02880 [Thermodesulfobacteriota bacterium]|nr:hypothetical protein [Thermodesulfobacteriota bacterium]
MAEYELYLVRDLSELKEGEAQVINVRKKENYEMRVVKAIVNSSGERLPGADKIWLRTKVGEQLSQPWSIKILKDYGSLPQHAGLY